MKHTNNFTIMILLIISSMLFGFVPAGYAQDIQDWSDPKNLSMSGSASNPSMVVDNAGVLHVIWLDQFDGYKYSQSTDGGLTWSPPLAVNFPFSNQAPPPVLLSDPNGNIHIFWLSDLNKFSYALTLAENLDSPPGWRKLVDLDSSVYDFAATQDSLGRVHVAYLKNPAPAAGTAGVFYRRSADGGLSWPGPKLLFESPYFRSLTSENAHIRMAVSDNAEDESVYVVWDDRTQKRIFITPSPDGGLNWGPIKEMVAPQADQGFRTPYNASIDVLDGKVLATWLVGETAGGCTPYSWSSSDGGETWGEQIPVLSGSAQCPERNEFIPTEPGYSTLLFSTQGELSLSIWDGEMWSTPQVQTGLSSITNPATFESILLGCKQATVFNGRLHIVGCDQGTGGDIWFMAWPLGSLDDLFPLPSEWKGDRKVTTIPRRMESLSAVSDENGNVHAIWIQSPYLATDTFVPRIEYSRWDGIEWTVPSPIITNLVAVSQTLSLQIDREQRLLLSWVNPNTNELLFTWAMAEGASTPLEWAVPVVLPTASKLASSPYMLVDATDRIAVAYAITLNEERGIYITQSVDLGETWSTPVKILDAVAEDWDMVDQPKLAVTGDGALHIMFARYVLVGGAQPAGLYYSRSQDGGITWNAPEIVTEQPAHWNEIVASQGILHRLWQENNRLTASTNHQISLDGGITWASPIRIPSDAELNSKPSVTIDWAGNIHFLQVIKQENHVFQEWEWSQDRWNLLDSRSVSTRYLNSPALVESGITTKGDIYSLVQLEEFLDNRIETNLLGMNRSLELTGMEKPLLASISTPSSLMNLEESPVPFPTPAVTYPVLDLNDPQPRFNRNIIGLVLIILVVVFIIVFTVPRRNKENY